MNGDDVHSKKKWSRWCVISLRSIGLNLAIVVILNSSYKLQFLDWSYKKFYGNDSKKVQKKIKDSLFSFYNEYANTFNAAKVFICSSSSVVSNVSNNQVVNERFSSMITSSHKWKVICFFKFYFFINFFIFFLQILFFIMIHLNFFLIRSLTLMTFLMVLL